MAPYPDYDHMRAVLLLTSGGSQSTISNPQPARHIRHPMKFGIVFSPYRPEILRARCVAPACSLQLPPPSSSSPRLLLLLPSDLHAFTDPLSRSHRSTFSYFLGPILSPRFSTTRDVPSARSLHATYYTVLLLVGFFKACRRWYMIGNPSLILDSSPYILSTSYRFSPDLLSTSLTLLCLLRDYRY